MKIAILHEMLIKLGGAEKVASIFLEMFPEADFFTLMYDEKKVGKSFPRSKIQGQVFSLPSQKIYNYTKKQRLSLLFMPRSIEKLNFSKYDLVIASCSAFAHGAIVGDKTKLVVYSHSPARYMWDWTNEYREDIGWNKGLKGLILGRVFLKLRQWDYYASSRADFIFANSNNTKKRIKKYYRREALILFPPVETSRFSKSLDFTDILLQKMNLKKGEYYIIISALTEFKKIEIAVKSFSQLPQNKLLIIGEGEYFGTLNSFAEKNVIFVGAKYGDELVALVQNSLGLIFPGEEDFGIVPIEVMAAGKPVFALRKGGLTETVLDGKTGAFFDDSEGSDFVKKFQVFHKQNRQGFYTAEACKEQAQKYSVQIFKEQLEKYIDKI